MTRIRNRLHLRNTRGAAANQYALVLGLIVVLALLSIVSVGRSVSDLMSIVANRLGAVNNTSGGAGASGGGSGGGGGNQPAGPFYGWGRNTSGELADGTYTNSLSPLSITSLGARPDVIAAGELAGCALTSGAIKCWGDNTYLQLGTGTAAAKSNVPIAVTGFSSTPTAISMHGYHICVAVTGGAQCWGLNNNGQLGNGTQTNSAAPVTVSSLGGAPSILTTGFNHTCALVGTNVRCWGYHANVTLGNGTTNPVSTVPVTLTGFAGTPSILQAGVDFTCLVSGTTTQCWGWNQFGQLGNGNTTNSAAPQTVSLGGGPSLLSVGVYHVCALVTSTTKCWGWNIEGQLGNGNTTNSSTPVNVTGLSSTPTQLTAGYAQTCAIVSGGAVQCWGGGSFGALGNGAAANSNTPVTVPGLSGITMLRIGDYSTLALQ